MNNNRNMNPELDYFELRRRHEEYKSRQRMAEAEAKAEEAPASPAAPVNSRNAAPAENIPEDIEFDQPEEFEAAEDFAEDYEESYDEDYEEDYDEAYDDEPEQDVNPFKTLLNLAKYLKEDPHVVAIADEGEVDYLIAFNIIEA